MAKRYRKRLSEQQQRFVHEYLIDFNAQQAAIRAGYSEANTAAGNHVMRNLQVMDEIRRRCLAAQSRLEMTADHIRSGFARIATDPREAGEGGPTWEARMVALRELGKLLGLYVAKVHVTGTLTLEDLLLAADKQKPAQLPAVTH